VGEVIRLDDPAVLVTLRRSRAARRFTLSVRPGEAGARLTAPSAARRAEAERFLDRHADWLRDALERTPQPVEVRIGATIPVGGVPREIAGLDGRGPVRLDGARLLAPSSAPGPALAAWLKLRARDVVAPAAEAAAARLGRPIGRISLRDMRSRWGSCTARGDIALSWRLAMAPTAVAEYVAVHEAAHLVEMNHGPRFWALVAELRPDYRVQRAWLRREGGELHRYRFASAAAV